MTKAPDTLQDLQRKIYAKAKANPSWRFWGLYVHVCKLETLHAAYAVAKANDGAPGSDGVTFDASRCFSYIRHWVELKIRRHLMRNAKRQGVGWRRWRTGWLYQTLGLFGTYRVRRATPTAVSVG